ncbi:MAG TPA: tyrosine--tRNA ligase, partial [Candidatus Atribacteria bacterium]|nr:tyrosine--tRNA ligase [Candidatus Atribacteria bacterium]
MKIPIAEQIKLIKRGVVDLITEDELVKKLERIEKEGGTLKVKEGFDPSAPDLHLGHTVTLRKLRQFQELGHRVQFVIGDFTGMIGDPTGKSQTRKQLTEEEVRENAKTYAKQVFKILDPDKTDVVFNSQWLSPLTFKDVILLTAKFTVARILERDDFQKRYKEGKPIGLHEFLYPIMQAYDSVALKSDVELGGTDQKFNLLVGRDLQREFGIEPQIVITLPLLEGLDGIEKMSKSLGNYVGIDEPANVMFGKIMSLPDHLMSKYFELLTDVPMEEIRKMEEGIKNNTVHPLEVKKRLAREIVKMYHTEEEAKEAQREFEAVFSKKEMPKEMKDIIVDSSLLKDGKIWIVRLLELSGFVKSRQEARRLIEQGGVRIDNEK